MLLIFVTQYCAVYIRQCIIMLTKIILTHWGRVTHICLSELTIIASDNGLSPGRRQAIIWHNAGLLLIEPLGTNFSDISIGIQTFSFNKMHLNMSSPKWRPFCLGLNVLKCFETNETRIDDVTSCLRKHHRHLKLLRLPTDCAIHSIAHIWFTEISRNWHSNCFECGFYLICLFVDWKLIKINTHDALHHYLPFNYKTGVDHAKRVTRAYCIIQCTNHEILCTLIPLKL